MINLIKKSKHYQDKKKNKLYNFSKIQLVMPITLSCFLIK